MLRNLVICVIVSICLPNSNVIIDALGYCAHIRDTYLDLDSFTLFYTANCNVTVAVTYLELDNVTSKLDTNFLCTSSKSVN